MLTKLRKIQIINQPNVLLKTLRVILFQVSPNNAIAMVIRLILKLRLMLILLNSRQSKIKKKLKEDLLKLRPRRRLLRKRPKDWKLKLKLPRRRPKKSKKKE